jgi:AAA domain
MIYSEPAEASSRVDQGRSQCRHGNADVPKVVATIKLIAKRLDMAVRIVVVDTLARAMAGGNENASEDMGALVANSDIIRDQSGACVLYVHHCGKDAARGSRGHSSLKAATDTEIEVTRGADQVSIARVTRQRDMESEGSFAFKLEPVELGCNQRGKAVTSCVVTPADTPKVSGVDQASITPTERIALRCLDQAMRADGILATVFDDATEGMVVRLADWRSWFYREGKPGADAEAKRKAFGRAVEGLNAKGRIGTRDDLFWPKAGRT